MRQLDMIEPELPLDGGGEAQASRWARRDAVALATQADRLAAWGRQRAPAPAFLELTPPPGPRTAPAVAPDAPPALLTLMQET